MQRDWLTVEEVADELNLKPDTIRNYIREGKLIAHRFGNTYRIFRKDLQNFLDERRTRKDE